MPHKSPLISYSTFRDFYQHIDIRYNLHFSDLGSKKILEHTFSKIV